LSNGGIQGFEATGTGPGMTAYTLPSLYPAANTSNTTPALDANLVPSGAVIGSDVLVLRTMDSGAVQLAPPYNDAAQVFVTQPNSIKSGQILVVTDCDRVSIFQATTVSTNSGITNVAHATGTAPGNTCPNWGVGGCPGKSYKQGAQIASFTTTVYYIAKSQDATYNGPSLYRNTWPNGTVTTTELVQGVENMQVLYGIDTDRDEPPNGIWHNVDRYVTADQIPNDPTTGKPDWSHVGSVRVALLVSGRVSSTATGQTNALKDQATYSADGVELKPQADTRERRVFTATVELRNRH
jgi:type IV pilus assembly protein PilW